MKLLAGFRDQDHEVWLELGLQSAFDATLERINRGHGFSEYRQAVQSAHRYGVPVCTHLIVGLPGEAGAESLASLERVLELGVEGLKLHPLHVVKGTRLANEWRRGEFQPLRFEEYIALEDLHLAIQDAAGFENDLASAYGVQRFCDELTAVLLTQINDPHEILDIVVPIHGIPHILWFAAKPTGAHSRCDPPSPKRHYYCPNGCRSATGPSSHSMR